MRFEKAGIYLLFTQSLVNDRPSASLNFGTGNSGVEETLNSNQIASA